MENHFYLTQSTDWVEEALQKPEWRWVEEAERAAGWARQEYEANRKRLQRQQKKLEALKHQDPVPRM